MSNALTHDKKTCPLLLFLSLICLKGYPQSETGNLKTSLKNMSPVKYLNETYQPDLTASTSTPTSDSLPTQQVKEKYVFTIPSQDSAKNKLRNSNASFTKKFLRAELYIGGFELAGMGVLILLPRRITKWEDDWAQDAMKNFKRSWTRPPIWDKDDWAINYIGHTVAGSYYYNAVRSQNATIFQSFVFSTFQSTFWEYVIEGIAERPSIQDLIITPVGGVLLGEATHYLTLRMHRNGFNMAEKIFVILFNPMYAVNNGFRH